MSCKVKTNRHGFLAFRLIWDQMRSWEGTGLPDTPENRKVAEAQAVLISHEIKQGAFDYLKWFPQGNKAQYFKETAKPASVGDYYRIWIERKKPPLVRKGLEHDYRRQFSRYILPKFESCELSEVTPKLLEAFRTYLLTDFGLSLKSCRNIIDGTFRAMMRDARIIDQLIDKDPFEFLRWPRIRRPKPDPFTEAERDKILAQFREKNSFYYPFVFTQFWTGMRPSETLALRWGDVDFGTERVSITKSRYFGAESETKTRASERTIRMLPGVADLLKNRKPLHVTEKDYVFQNQEGRPIDEDKWRKKHWYRALRAAAVRERKFYATRHTYISVALSVGVNIKWLAEQCGTSVAMIEQDYGRFIRDDGDAPLRALVQQAKSETLGETTANDSSAKQRQLVGISRKKKWSGRVELWLAATGKPLSTFRHESDVHAAAFSPEGNRVLTAGRIVTIWDAERGRPLAELKGHQFQVNTAVFSPDGQQVLTASPDWTSCLWDSRSGALITELRGHQSGISSAVFGPDATTVLTASNDRTARIWKTDKTTATLIAKFPSPDRTIASALFSPDGRRVVTASGNTARVWDITSKRLITELQGHQGTVFNAVFSPDGQRIATASRDNTAAIWNASTGALLNELRGHQDMVVSAVFSPDGQQVATASNDSTARIWSTSTGALIREFHGHKQTLANVMFSPDGKQLATASGDATARVWDAKTGITIWELRGHRSIVRNVVFSPNGRQLATASGDGIVRVWENSTGNLSTELRGHRGEVLSIAFSRDGTQLVTASTDTTARVWDVKQGTLISELRGHRSTVNNATFAPSGSHVATASIDKTAHVWDAKSGALLLKLQHPNVVITAAFSPDGQQLLTAGFDSILRVWDVSRVYLDSRALIDHVRQLLRRVRRTASPDECSLYFTSSIGARPNECSSASAERF